MTKTYIGVKMVTAWPEERDGKPGYAVKYEDGYMSWSPEEAFERAYFPLAEGQNRKIAQADVDAFMGQIVGAQLDEKTTLVTAETITGFRQHEVSSCVDPANYDHALGVQIATNRIKNRIWPMLGFVLQWALYGLKKTPASVVHRSDCATNNGPALPAGPCDCGAAESPQGGDAA